jgi:hypothetical protein
LCSPTPCTSLHILYANTYTYRVLYMYQYSVILIEAKVTL